MSSVGKQEIALAKLIERRKEHDRLLLANIADHLEAATERGDTIISLSIEDMRWLWTRLATQLSFPDGDLPK